MYQITPWPGGFGGHIGLVADVTVNSSYFLKQIAPIIYVTTADLHSVGEYYGKFGINHCYACSHKVTFSSASGPYPSFTQFWYKGLINASINDGVKFYQQTASHTVPIVTTSLVRCGSFSLHTHLLICTIQLTISHAVCRVL